MMSMPFTPRAPIPTPTAGSLLRAPKLTEEEREAVLIAGIVTDSNGHSVRGAKVELMKPLSNLAISTTTTDRGGLYSFILRIGEGELKVKVTSTRGTRVQNVHAVKGQFAQLDFTL
jgi:hypothetical protein